MDFQHGNPRISRRPARSFVPYRVTLVTRGRAPLLADSRLARSVCRALHHCDQIQLTHSWCYMVMPDQLHWLFSLPGSHSFSQAVGIARGRASQLAGLSLWQKGFCGGALGEEDDILQVARSLIATPLRAGLVDNVADYPYWNAVWL